MVSIVKVHELRLPIVAPIRLVRAGKHVIRVAVDGRARLYLDTSSAVAQRASLVFGYLVRPFGLPSHAGDELRDERRRLLRIIEDICAPLGSCESDVEHASLLTELKRVGLA